MTGGALTVFVLGLRHGADPDHLAAVDNITRNSVARYPRLTRIVGLLFASGHGFMVLALAGVAGYLGSRMSAHASLLEGFGTWISIAVLFAMAGFNLVALSRQRETRAYGVRSALLPKIMRDAGSPWIAIPIGVLFGIGFETSSQIAAYTLAFGADVGGALVVGAMFYIGMACTDTLDCLFVRRVMTSDVRMANTLMRVWIVSVSVFAVAVALSELGHALGVRPVVSELTMSAILTGFLALVYVAICSAGLWKRARAS